MKQQKYTYWSILQGNYGYGWDDLVYYDRSKPEQIAEIKSDLKATKYVTLQKTQTMQAVK